MTIFEKIANKEIPATLLYEDDEIIAFRDISPQAPVHVLITPRKCTPTINDVEPKQAELLGRMILVAKEIAKQEGIAEGGYRLVMNCNEDGGQSVDHIHIHLLGGRKLSWPPG